MTQSRAHVNYSEYYAVEAEGHRVGLMTCLRCGALVLVGDPACDGPEIHTQWHVQRDTPDAK